MISSQVTKSNIITNEVEYVAKIDINENEIKIQSNRDIFLKLLAENMV